MPKISNANTVIDSASKPVILAESITKEFRIKHSHSMKEAFISFIKKEKSYSTFKAVDNLSFEVMAGESVALLGHNGSGKSTTLKMLSGVQQPDAGWIRTRGRVGGLLEVGAGFHPNLTGLDNVYLNAAILGMSKTETDERLEEILAFADIGDFIDTEVKRYSSGMRARLGFAVAVHIELDIILVDEVLSVGDAAFRAKCDDKILELREAGKTFFIVSHNMSTVKKLCDRGIVLKKGKTIFDGNIEKAISIVKGK